MFTPKAEASSRQNEQISDAIDEAYTPFENDECVANLARRFPQCPHDEILAVLQQAKYRGGQAARALRKKYDEKRESSHVEQSRAEQRGGLNPSNSPEPAAVPAPVFLDEELKHLHEYADRPLPDEEAEATTRLEFPPSIRSVILDIGPNVHPIVPPPDDSVFVISIEPLPRQVS